MDPVFFDAFRQASRYSSKKEVEDICFKALIDSYTRVKEVHGIATLNENRIRDQFIIDLEQSNDLIRHAIDNYIIIVIPESWDAVKRKRADIGFILPFYRRTLVIECKRLLSAEQRYLDDGLIRFIRLEYAEREKDAAMLGFIIKPKRFSNVVQKIKDKVCQFYFLVLIDKPVLDYRPSFQSIHVRSDDTKILISHLFFEFQ